jgi:hypothetical protein
MGLCIIWRHWRGTVNYRRLCLCTFTIVRWWNHIFLGDTICSIKGIE